MQPPSAASRGRAVARALAGAAAALIGLAHAADHGPAPDTFFEKPRMTAAKISPDGRTVAITMAASKTDHVQLVALDLETMKLTPVAGYENADVRSFHWVNDHRLVFDLEDRDLPEGKRYRAGAPGLYAVNTDGSALRELVNRWDGDSQSLFAHNVRLSRILPWNTYFQHTVGDQTTDAVYVVRPLEIDEKQSDYFQLQRLDTLSGLVSGIDAPPHAFDWIFDSKGELRLVVTDKENRGKVMAREPGGKEWVALADFEYLSSDMSFHPSYIDQDGTLFVEARNGGDKVAVWTYDLAHRKLADKAWLVSQRRDLDPDYLTVDGKLAGLRYDGDAEVTQWILPEMEALQAKVDKMLPSTVNRVDVGSRGDGRFVLIRSWSDRVPGLFFLYDRPKEKLVRLGNAQPDVDPQQMATMDPVHYAARDGLDIPAWLTIPHGAERKNLPLVVLVHGGPNVDARSWGWDPEVQFLAAHGYAVLEPQFRGTTGYGSHFFTAGWKQWGLAMQDDVADGVKWAVAQGIADPKRVCIAGASYGGYAVLMGLARDPDLYRCGVDWVGVTDLQLMYTADWSDTSDAQKKYGMPKLIGDPVADAAQLKASSPTANVARIHVPLLMAYGGRDHRVPIEHGEYFHDALLKQPGAKVEWVVYKDEGHGWRSLETNIDFWNRVARFLDANIGAR